MVAAFNRVQIENITSHQVPERGKRGKIYKIDFPQMLVHPPSTLLLVGNLIVLPAQDCTESPKISCALKSLTALELFDTWNQRNEDLRYTHYTATGASRIDRMYATRNMDKKQCEICAVAFSDHLAVILHTKCLATTNNLGEGSYAR
jgi:hypothetical protein